ncbi:hypothetical protein AAULR_13042, partial [Lacticaseibacillus rhamnosus MTCC 5462]
LTWLPDPEPVYSAHNPAIMSGILTRRQLLIFCKAACAFCYPPGLLTNQCNDSAPFPIAD